MAYAVVWTATAAADLRAAAQYIARDNPGAAAGLVKRILARVDAAAAFPFAQRRVPEIEAEHTREAVLNPYRVVYAVNEAAATITILRVWHAARGVPGLDKL